MSHFSKLAVKWSILNIFRNGQNFSNLKLNSYLVYVAIEFKITKKDSPPLKNPFNEWSLYSLLTP